MSQRSSVTQPCYDSSISMRSVWREKADGQNTWQLLKIDRSHDAKAFIAFPVIYIELVWRLYGSAFSFPFSFSLSFLQHHTCFQTKIWLSSRSLQFLYERPLLKLFLPAHSHISHISQSIYRLGLGLIYTQNGDTRHLYFVALHGCAQPVHVVCQPCATSQDLYKFVHPTSLLQHRSII